MFKKTRVELGRGHLIKYTIFEIKRLFSVYLHVFNTIEQDRFHTHAFSGVSFLLKGGYEEEVKETDGSFKKKWIGRGIRYIPHSHNHRLLTSTTNSVSLLFAGPWRKTWTEEFPSTPENPGIVRVLGWGRKEITRKYLD